MKKMLAILLLVIGITSFGETIRLTTGEWPPYLSKKLNSGGFGTAIVSAAFNAVDFDVEYRYLPWKRTFVYAETGKDMSGNKINGTILWVKTEDREKNFYYSKPVVEDDQLLFSLKSKPVTWNKMEDLKWARIGLTLHAKYPAFIGYENMLNLERVGGYDLLFKRLLGKRIDALPYEVNVAKYYMRKNLTEAQREKIMSHSKPLATLKYYLILNKVDSDNERIRDKFNEGLDMIYNNGTYSKIKAKFDNGYYDN